MRPAKDMVVLNPVSRFCIEETRGMKRSVDGFLCIKGKLSNDPTRINYKYLR
jgi:hypothetical protein